MSSVPPLRPENLTPKILLEKILDEKFNGEIAVIVLLIHEDGGVTVRSTPMPNRDVVYAARVLDEIVTSIVTGD